MLQWNGGECAAILGDRKQTRRALKGRYGKGDAFHQEQKFRVMTRPAPGAQASPTGSSSTTSTDLASIEIAAAMGSGRRDNGRRGGAGQCRAPTQGTAATATVRELTDFAEATATSTGTDDDDDDFNAPVVAPEPQWHAALLPVQMQGYHAPFRPEIVDVTNDVGVAAYDRPDMFAAEEAAVYGNAPSEVYATGVAADEFTFPELSASPTRSYDHVLEDFDDDASLGAVACGGDAAGPTDGAGWFFPMHVHPSYAP